MKENIHRVMVSEKEILGFRTSDFLGIFIMVIPFIISIRFNKYDPAKYILFIQTAQETNINIRPGLISALCSAAFYASLILRYEGIFRGNNLFEAVISTVRAFLNCWVLAALIATAIPSANNLAGNSSSIRVFFANPEASLLLLGILLSWLGIRTIAGYSWILFIIAAWKRLLIVQSAMGMWGAVFIFSLAISLFLQIKNYAKVSEFLQDFRGVASEYGTNIKTDINEAIEDAEISLQDMSGIAGGRMPPISKDKKGNVKVDWESLDVNHDGVVDKKDFEMMYRDKKE